MIRVSESILIVARPDRWHDALRALLTAIPYLKIVGQTDHGLTIMQLVAEHQPTLVLVDARVLEEEIGAVLKQLKATQPRIRYIVLADNGQQQQTAAAVGADKVLLRGFPPTQLFAIIEQQLSQQKT